MNFKFRISYFQFKCSKTSKFKFLKFQTSNQNRPSQISAPKVQKKKSNLSNLKFQPSKIRISKTSNQKSRNPSSCVALRKPCQQSTLLAWIFFLRRSRSHANSQPCWHGFLFATLAPLVSLKPNMLRLLGAPMLRTQCFSPSASHPMLRIQCFASIASHPVLRTQCFAPHASHPMLRTQCFAPNASEGVGRSPPPTPPLYAATSPWVAHSAA